MGVIKSRLAALTITVRSPDGELGAEAVGGRLSRLVLRPDAYRRYREPDLEAALGSTLTALFGAHERGVDETLACVGLTRRTDPARANDAAQRRYLEAVRELTVVGRSPQGLVRFRTLGLREWRCRIVPGTVDALSEEEFVAETRYAVEHARAVFGYEVAVLQHEHLDRRLPGPVPA